MTQKVIWEDRDCRIVDLGLMAYKEAYSLQKKYVDEVCQGGKGNLLMCEHPPVLTLGRLAREENILFLREEINRREVEIVAIDRGGDITLHSPGQLVIYPILNLAHYKKDLKYYLHKLEQVIIDFLREFDILADRIPDNRGVWVGNKKIASIGIGVRKWVSFHGAAVNVNTDLSLFSMIRPCGLDVQMTSIREIKGREADFSMAKMKLVEIFCRHFSLQYGESLNLQGAVK